MDVDVELGGLPELEARLAHAHDGILDLTRQLGAQLMDTAPPMLAITSVTMRPRTWGAGDMWTLPAGTWVAGRDGGIHLPDNPDDLTTHVQQLLDGH